MNEKLWVDSKDGAQLENHDKSQSYFIVCLQNEYRGEILFVNLKTYYLKREYCGDFYRETYVLQYL